jgi:predicted transcriptional regulator
MKRIASILSVFLFVLVSSSCGEVSGKSESVSVSAKDKKVDVYYFHFTRRCVTCVAVENESKKAIEELYADKIKTGEVIFHEINLDLEDGKKIAQELNQNGQGLIVVSEKSIVDLTQQGFMFAMRDPEKLKDALKQAVDNFLR